jgi:uncharacterized protein YndB with AHSA1/START domain
MKNLTYSIIINKPCEIVFDKIMDKSVYPDWAKAWGDGMTYEGEWKEGEYISFFDKSQGGTRVIIEELKPNQSIKCRHIAMVNPQNIEIELTDEIMKKWIGSREDYYFRADGNQQTIMEVKMEVDQVFQEMFDNAWPI